MRVALWLTAAAVAANDPASAQSGDITFNGQISTQTCVVQPISNGDQDGTHFTVNLPSINAYSLREAGMRGAAIPFHVVVGSGSEPCRAASVHAQFRNVGDNNAAGRLGNQGTAQNVDVVVLNAQFEDIDLNSNANTLPVMIDPEVGVGVLSWHGSYHATAAALPGTVLARVEYVLVYQ